MFNVIVKGLIIKDKKILTLKRSMLDDIGPGIWELVGGRLENNESIESGLLREIKEETNLDCSITRLLYATTYYSEKTQNCIILLYLCNSSQDSIVLSDEHSDYRWVSVDESRQLLGGSILNDLEKFKVLEIEELI